MTPVYMDLAAYRKRQVITKINTHFQNVKSTMKVAISISEGRLIYPGQ